MKKIGLMLLVVVALMFSACSDTGSETLQSSKTQVLSDAIANKSASVADVYVSLAKDDFYHENIARETLEMNGVDTSVLTDAEIDELVVTYVTTQAGASAPSSQRAPSRSIISDVLDSGDAILGSIVNLADTDIGQSVMSLAFDLVLESKELTMVMIDLAIKSETISDIMVDALKDDWALTRKMEPWIETDPAFTNKFLDLANVRPRVAKMTFEMMETRLYQPLTVSMSLDKNVTVKMGALMNVYNAYFVLPNEGVQGEFGMTDNFGSIFFDEANLEANRVFFGSLFLHPESTASFVTAFTTVKARDAITSRAFLDHVFIGAKEVDGFQNNIVIAESMLAGIDSYGMTVYAPSFVGFALLIDSERYVPYAKTFGATAIYYCEVNNIDSTDLLLIASEQMGFDSDVMLEGYNEYVGYFEIITDLF